MKQLNMKLFRGHVNNKRNCNFFLNLYYFWWSLYYYLHFLSSANAESIEYRKPSNQTSPHAYYILDMFSESVSIHENVRNENIFILLLSHLIPNVICFSLWLALLPWHFTLAKVTFRAGTCFVEILRARLWCGHFPRSQRGKWPWFAKRVLIDYRVRITFSVNYIVGIILTS